MTAIVIITALAGYAFIVRMSLWDERRACDAALDALERQVCMRLDTDAAADLLAADLAGVTSERDEARELARLSVATAPARRFLAARALA